MKQRTPNANEGEACHEAELEALLLASPAMDPGRTEFFVQRLLMCQTPEEIKLVVGVERLGWDWKQAASLMNMTPLRVQEVHAGIGCRVSRAWERISKGRLMRVKKNPTGV